jgi:Transmembrane secretion effector
MTLGPSAYDQLLSALGAGALIGAAMLPKLKAIASVDGLITSASAVFATVTIGLASLRNYKGFWNAKASALLRSPDSQGHSARYSSMDGRVSSGRAEFA